MEQITTQKYQSIVVKRDGSCEPFNKDKIRNAITMAIVATNSTHDSKLEIDQLTTLVVDRLQEDNAHTYPIERIQDTVEKVLMSDPRYQDVAKKYILYREDRARLRQKNSEIFQFIAEVIDEACKHLNAVSPEMLKEETFKQLYSGSSHSDIMQAAIMSARTKIEQEPDYSYVAARILLMQLESEVADNKLLTFSRYIHFAVEQELLHPNMLSFNLDRLGKAIVIDRDNQFTYLGLQTLYDRYFIQWQGKRLELPQFFFMRVAMGLALNEGEQKNERAIEFYHTLSSFDFMCSTPTLFNSGTLRPQLSSCYLSTIEDSAEGITGAIADNALLSKYAGGIGNDWTPVRAMGAHIKGTNGKSGGVIPFMKMAESGLIAFNQSGKRKGAGCAYLETWHLDIEEFLELRKNTGDDRRRTHDMNTANWIPDLFMKRVMSETIWTLFSPNEVPDLHDLYGEAFETRYTEYEAMAERGEIKQFKKIPAVTLWRKMLSMLFETGHPWITFKDTCNTRSPQQHVGVVHCSNLCTEITLNTNKEEVAVCNLGSIHLANHIIDGELDVLKLKRSVKTAMRILDNVIDINFYSIPQAQTSNMRHRPVGLGIMGFQDALYKLGIAYASDAAVDFANDSMEAISYYAIEASADLAEERGRYSTFEGSLWSKGIFPIDTITLKQKRELLDWDSLRERVMRVGMRNSNCMAIAPTATISNICGVSQSIEPTYQNLFVKSNLSGEFTVINPYLVNDLKKLGLWDAVMIADLKYYDGSVQKIERIPLYLKELYATAFEIDQMWLIEAASQRQQWIDQSQSLNLYMAEPNGKKLDALYKLAWVRGLKTTYYLRTMGASHVEKSTIEDGKLNAVKEVCSILDPNCESCQ